MFKSPPGIEKSSLYPYQQDAVKTVIRYLNSGTHKNGNASLVQMPTGSGKTGIIATLSRLCPGIKRVLILAPRVAIKEQLLREVGGDFFQKINLKPKKRAVLPLDKKYITGSGAIKEDFVFIGTIQQLDTWRRSSVKEYETLRETLDLLIMDEAHYEPAMSWSKATRGLEKPFLLVTATPYRNDLKRFQFDESAISTLRFQDAVAKNFIRDVNIISRPPQENIESFVKDIWNIFLSKFPKSSHPNARLIIRCEHSQNIRRICNAFKKLDTGVLGIHDNFKGSSERYLKNSVPDPKKTNEQVWVHQNKLLEGVDEPEFRMAAVYGEIGSVRSLVQQIGRLIRNPGKKPNQVAYLIDYSDRGLDQKWKRFLEYDQAITPKKLSQSLAVQVSEALNKTLPDLEYFDKDFRRPFTLDGIEKPEIEFKVPKSAYIIEKEKDFSIKNFENWIKEELIDKDCSFKCIEVNEGIIIPYLSSRNSVFLTENYFLENRLGLVILQTSDHVVSFLDTGGIFPGGNSEAGFLGPVKPKKLQKLFKNSKKSKLSEISTRNSSISDSSIRTRTLTALSLNDTAPLFDDFQHFVTTARGYTQEKAGQSPIRRYLGFSRGKISDPGKLILLKDYIDWIQSIFKKIESSRGQLSYFTRYASLLNSPPKKTTPKNILIDFSEAYDLFEPVSSGSKGSQLIIDESCCDCTKDENGKITFDLSANQENITIEIKYDERRQTYQLISKELDAIYKMVATEARPENLTTFLNKRQAFNVIPEQSNTVYGHGVFFDPNIPTGDAFKLSEFPLADNLVEMKRLSSISSEKGTNCLPDGSGWEDGCLFNLIDKINEGGSPFEEYIDNIDILVCDDMNYEACDFWLSDRNGERVIMIHAKASRKIKHTSASSMQEVYAQAIKNLSSLSLFSPVKPKNQNRWHSNWTAPKVKGCVTKRIRMGTRDKDAIWTELEKRIRKPSTVKEVWIVLGQILSKKHLLDDLAKDEPKPQTIHNINLLKNAVATASSVGANLKVFCMP